TSPHGLAGRAQPSPTSGFSCPDCALAANRVAELFEQVAVPLIGLQGLRQLLHELLLLAAELLGRNNLDVHEEVATTAAAQVLNALVAQSEHLAGLSPGADLELLLAFERRHLHRGAEGRPREVDVELDVKVVLHA